jgi:hypothetical protein
MQRIPTAEPGFQEPDEAQQPDRARQPDRAQQTDKVRQTDKTPQADRTPDRARQTDKVQQADKVQQRTETPGRTPEPQHRATPAEHHDDQVFEDQDVERYREQWRELQSGFVDEPKSAVREADSLVSQMMETFTAHLTERKRALSGQWEGDGDKDTEQLRLALRRYRALFDQMLAVK